MSTSGIICRIHANTHTLRNETERMTLTFVEQNRLSFSISGNKPLNAN